MKKTIMLTAMTLLMMGCSSLDEPEVKNEQTKVTMTFTPYVMETMTRSESSISGVVSHLDVWIYESGSEVTAIHQVSTDADFGSISLTLDKSKSYTLYAIGHNGNAAATLSDGVISFVGDVFKESMFYTTIFTPATNSSLSCLMQRIVGKFRIETTDVLPDGADHIALEITNTATKWSVDWTPANLTTRTMNYTDLSSRVGTELVLNTYIISSMEVTTGFDVTVTTYNSKNDVVYQQVFSDVPIRNGYKTTYRGKLFSSGVTAGFTVDDWNEFDVVEF